MNIRSLIPNQVVNLFWHLPIAMIANLIYGFPSKKLTAIGVTGTDGKTTTANMLYHVLHKAGYRVALISTVSARIGDEELDTGFHVTSPSPLLLQKLLQKIVNQGITHVVLETTSHGLDQYRFWGIKFSGGIVTNITEDHLDYHKTWEHYALSKAILFKHTEFAVLNCEDKSYTYLKPLVHGVILTYGKEKGEWNNSSFPMKLQILGEYNYLNALAAAAAAAQLGVNKTEIKRALESFSGVSGRMEIIQQNPFLTVVDFAHTPNALYTALTELRKSTRKRLIAVFGCAGERDPNRRKMGKIAAQKADITIITAEDPRLEGVDKISKDIASWANQGGAIEVDADSLKNNTIRYPIYIKQPDRLAAITLALQLATKGDTVGVFGKGHERSMCFGTQEIPWSDQEAVRKIITTLHHDK